MSKKKKMLLIGGTGIIGSATACIANMLGYVVYVIGLAPNNEDLPATAIQCVCDRRNAVEFAFLASKLNDCVGEWDIVFDIIGSCAEDARQTIALFGDRTKRLVFLSTTLVYSRRHQTSIITSSHPLAEPGELGGYVDKKVGMEKIIQAEKRARWTILRPYHILGKRSLLGCVPDHNRDMQLLERLRNGEALSLCCGGRIMLNVVHPDDIARVAISVSTTSSSIWRVYNCVNPEVVFARDYYEQVAKQNGVALLIHFKSYEEIWNEQKGWELTTLTHLYDVSDLARDIGYVPQISYQQCIADAINFPALPGGMVHQRMTAPPRPKKPSWLCDK